MTASSLSVAASTTPSGPQIELRPQNVEAVFLANSIGCDKEQVILHASSRRNDLRGSLCPKWPIGSQGDHVGALQGQQSHRFRKGTVVTDSKSDAHVTGLVDLEGNVATIHKPIDP